MYIQGYYHHQKQMKIFQHTHWVTRSSISFLFMMMIQMDTTYIFKQKIMLERFVLVWLDCISMFLFTRSKHKNYRLFDLLENNDSCYTLIYCFHDKKTSCKTRQEHISYQFTSDRSFFLLRWGFFSLVAMLLLFYICIYVNIYI